MKRKVLHLSGCLLSIILFTTQTQAQDKSWIAPRDSSKFVNPLRGNDLAAEDGKKIYQARCVTCHGESGRGNGPSGAALTPRPANFLSTQIRKENDWAIFWKLSEGRPPMPSYKTKLTKQQRWQLVAYIRKLQESH